MLAGSVTTGLAQAADLLRNRVSVDLSAPISPTDLVAISDAIGELDGISPEMARPLTKHPNPSSLEHRSTSSNSPTTTAPTRPTRRSPATVSSSTSATSRISRLPQTSTPDCDPCSMTGSPTPKARTGHRNGWSLLYENDERASFIHISDDGVSFGAEMGANGWIWAGASGGGPTSR